MNKAIANYQAHTNPTTTKIKVIRITKKTKLKSWVRKTITGGVLSLMFTGAIIAHAVSNPDVEYKKVYISEGGTAFGAINELNIGSGVDVRDLMPLFEEKNDVNASTISVGAYYIPVVQK